MIKIPKIGTIVIVIGLVAALYFASTQGLFGSENDEAGTIISMRVTEFQSSDTQTVIIPIDDAANSLSIFNKPQYQPLSVITLPPIDRSKFYTVEFDITIDIGAETPGNINTGTVGLLVSANRYGLPTPNDGDVRWDYCVIEGDNHLSTRANPVTVPLGTSTVSLNKANGEYFTAYRNSVSALVTGGIPGGWFDTNGYIIEVTVVIGDVTKVVSMEFTTVIGTVGQVVVTIQSVNVVTTQV